jgi:hypothetical protein
VLSNPAVWTATGWPVGFSSSDLTHPYFRFAEIGYEVDIYSPVGGRCGTDAMIDPDDASRWKAEAVISRGFKHDPDFMRLVENTGQSRRHRRAALRRTGRGRRPGSDVHLREGREPPGQVLGVLRDRQADRRALPPRRHPALIANAEEEFPDRAVWDTSALPKDKHVMPRRIEDELRRLGANFVQAGLEGIRDPRRQPHHRSANFSGAETTEEVIVEAVGR